MWQSQIWPRLCRGLAEEEEGKGGGHSSWAAMRRRGACVGIGNNIGFRNEEKQCATRQDAHACARCGGVQRERGVE